MAPSSSAPLVGFLWFAALHGGLRTPRLTEVSTFGDGATLDVPGSPRVILVPGHTPGSAALHIASLDALFVGDAMATYAVTNGQRGPQIAPFTADRQQALASLARLEDVPARYVLPGHGDPWMDGVREAAARVRATAGPARLTPGRGPDRAGQSTGCRTSVRRRAGAERRGSPR